MLTNDRLHAHYKGKVNLKNFGIDKDHSEDLEMCATIGQNVLPAKSYHYCFHLIGRPRPHIFQIFLLRFQCRLIITVGSTAKWTFCFQKSPRCGYFFHIIFFHIVGILCRKIPPENIFVQKYFYLCSINYPPTIYGWSK